MSSSSNADEETKALSPDKITTNSPISSAGMHLSQVTLKPENSVTHTLRFTDVQASVNNGTCCKGNHSRQVLRDVSGEATSGSEGVFAILGPSGAGKTTLLDIIAGRKTDGKFGGNISVDGIAYTSISRRKQVFGYVMQEETSYHASP